MEPWRDQEHFDQRVLEFYGRQFDEADRLVSRSAQGVLEFERTQQLVRERVLPGAHVLDIGGATGVHAAALAARGDIVELVDPVPAHVEAARAQGTFSARLGDARRLDFADDTFEAALLLGPLYHLVDRSDRLQAWREAIRVVRPGGWVFGAGISRLCTTGFVTIIEPARRQSADGTVLSRTPLPPGWQRLMEEGRGTGSESAFPGAHYHLAEELLEEATEAGLTDVEVLGLEGPAGQALEVSRTDDPDLLHAARQLAAAFADQPGLRDLSPHLLALGRTTTKPAEPARQEMA